MDFGRRIRRRVRRSWVRGRGNVMTKAGRAVERVIHPRDPRRFAASIPIIINNFNRLESLVRLLDWLEAAGMINIHILDNDSSYPPLLDFYNNTHYAVVRLNANLGHRALWRTSAYWRLCRSYFVYTDPDVVPNEECPYDAVYQFLVKLREYKDVDKVGFGLRIDDLPACYKYKKEVMEWEQRFWKREREPGLFEAKIDTTFALYRPFSMARAGAPALRTGFPYVARHWPWYADSNNPSDEDRYYKEMAKPRLGFWAGKRPRGLDMVY